MSRCRIESTINDELRCRQQVYPIILPFPNEQAQVGFNFLVFALYLAVGLRMIGSGKTCVYPESLVQGSHASRCKLGSSVTNNLLRDPMQGEYVVEVDGCDTIRSNMRCARK